MPLEKYKVVGIKLQEGKPNHIVSLKHGRIDFDRLTDTRAKELVEAGFKYLEEIKPESPSKGGKPSIALPEA